jgi:hypothetical protein
MNIKFSFTISECGLTQFLRFALVVIVVVLI